MDLQSLKISTTNEIINFALVQTEAPKEQLQPYQLESSINIVNVGAVPIWCQHLYNYATIIRQRMVELDNYDDWKSRPKYDQEYGLLYQKQNEIDTYIQNYFNQEVRKKLNLESCRIIISSGWQLFAKTQTYA